VEVVSAAPAFTAEALRTGGLIDLGVVQVNEIVEVRPPLIAALERVLRATRPDIPLTGAARAHALMGDTTSRFLLLGYQLHGKPELDWLTRAADSLHAVARFGVLARVESDEVGYSKTEVPPSNPTPGLPEQRMNVVHRDARVSVVIYDLTTRASVFSGEYVGTTSAMEPDTLPRLPMTPAEMPAVGAQTGPPSGSGPPPPGPGPRSSAEPPPLAKAAEAAFLEWVRTLPGTTAPGTGVGPP
jgi:hypothetical protein